MKIISLSDFRDSLWKLCILPRGVREKSSIVVNVDFILCQPDNWALNKTTGTGYSGFVGLKKALSFHSSSTDKVKRWKSRENISASRVGRAENGSLLITTRSLELFASGFFI